MPTLRILTNAQAFPEDRPNLLAQASRTVAEMLGKPESYVMVILEDCTPFPRGWRLGGDAAWGGRSRKAGSYGRRDDRYLFPRQID
jgi:phenylpyruvate tautomerase PptA (4-oxalocrotonate tautomerase family)